MNLLAFSEQENASFFSFLQRQEKEMHSVTKKRLNSLCQFCGGGCALGLNTCSTCRRVAKLKERKKCQK